MGNRAVVGNLPERAEEVALLAEQIASRYQPPETGGWSDIGDPVTLRILLEGVSSGLKNTDACLAAGIHVDTLTNWMKRADAEPDSPYSALSEAIKSARAAGKRWHLENIKRHSLREWTASAWTLERTDPEQFALRKDDKTQPAVIVQIGAGVSDVKVGVLVQQPTFASEPQQDSQVMHSLTADTGSDNTELC